MIPGVRQTSPRCLGGFRRFYFLGLKGPPAKGKDPAKLRLLAAGKVIKEGDI
jgi:hypothetical protein